MNPIVNINGSPPALPSISARGPAIADGKPVPASGKELPPAPEIQTVERAVSQIKDFLSNSQRQLNFQLDDTSGRTIIRVTNPETGEVIRQIPSEEVLRLAASIRTSGFQLINELA
jgi:flagellar protein FlaG